MNYDTSEDANVSKESSSSNPIFDLGLDDDSMETTTTTTTTTTTSTSSTSTTTSSTNSSEHESMALITRMSQTVSSATQKVFSYFQKGSSVVFRWYWVGGIIFWVVGLPLIRTRDKQIQFEELLARFSYKVKELSAEQNAFRQSKLKHI